MVSESDPLRWLQEWYLRQCDGDWEHQSGIEIGTLDNPGWFIRIDLADTELEDQPFAEIKRDVDEQDWVDCRVRDNRFEGHGGPRNLEDLIEEFRRWQQRGEASDNP
jgi:hypothetical protein